MIKTLLLTPPFTQLNTPYPATAYLKGFLNTQNIAARQADLGIEVINALFSRAGLRAMFDAIDRTVVWSENAQRIMALSADYIRTIDAVILFLQGRNPTLAHLLADGDFLPEASRFSQVDDLEWAFGAMGTQDKAKHIATLYLEDLADLITECVDEHFGFSRYAERLGRSASNFDALYLALATPYTYIDGLLIRQLEHYFSVEIPELVIVTVPFPGNLYSALRCGQWIKKHYPSVKIAMGGGFANTELRSVSDVRVFEFWDFICLDDGEAPLQNLIEYMVGKRPLALLKRTFALNHGQEVEYFNHSLSADYRQAKVGTPDYTGLPLDSYISVIELANPMHRLWSDGRWNKLTMAHGCYWGKCTFCDISLDYIKVYEPLTAALLCDRVEELIAATGETGFHFVDEAAPPALMRAFALEVCRRGLTISWWANIRFEKSFTPDLCVLLKASGCIAVSGGLEVASDRLLALIQKGVTVSQVARVTRNFTAAGIMVHAYLMYGFPTQTAQETVDSLEMVRQLFEQGVLQSGFWHQFAMTAHSPVGMSPETFQVKRLSNAVGSFANNDLEHSDPTGANHDAFSYGLKKSLLNYMHGICFEFPLQKWFDFKVPTTKIPKNYIENALNEVENTFPKPTSKVVWLGAMPTVRQQTKVKKGKAEDWLQLTFDTKKTRETIEIEAVRGAWLLAKLPELSPQNADTRSYKDLEADFEARLDFGEFILFWYSRPLEQLRDIGLLVV